MDPLSEVFSLLDIESARSTRFEASGAWALRFPAKPTLKFAAVLRGGCWLALPDQPPQRLRAGNTFLLANAPSYILASDLGRIPDDGLLLFDQGRAKLGRLGGDETVMIAGSFAFGSANAQLLMERLPPLMILSSDQPRAALLRNTLEVLDLELAEDQMGAGLLTRRLADILLVQALRAYVDDQGAENTGWLGALNDEKIGKAIRLMHGRVDHRWKVEELASAVGMSRSAFALRFKALVGMPPLEYLLRWRMQLARNALRGGNENNLAGLALRLGYASESAFGNAFKRLFGHSPRRDRSRQAARRGPS